MTNELTTKERLLESALHAFARDGFAAASVRDICLRAGVNNASIHYHFRGKAPLYQETVRFYAQKNAQEELRLDPKDPRESLRMFYAARLKALCPSSPRLMLFCIYSREQVDSSGLIEDVMSHYIRANLALMTRFVRAVVFPRKCSSAQVRHLALLLSSLTAPYFMGRKWLAKESPEFYTPTGLDALASTLASIAMVQLENETALQCA